MDFGRRLGLGRVAENFAHAAGDAGGVDADFGELFGLIGSLGYEGLVGLKFSPAADDADAVARVIELSST